MLEQLLQVLPRYAYLQTLGEPSEACTVLRKPIVLAMVYETASKNLLVAMIETLSDRLACDDGFVQLVSSWRQLPLVPHLLSEDLSDVQDLPESRFGGRRS